MMPQMQNWNTRDQVLGSLFIAECIWDGNETNKFINKQYTVKYITNPDGSITKHEHWDREVNSFVHNRTSAVVFGISGMYLGLKSADILPEIRFPLLLGLDFSIWGGADFNRGFFSKTVNW